MTRRTRNRESNRQPRSQGLTPRVGRWTLGLGSAGTIVGMRSRPIGSIIGAIGGVIFVLVNAGAVPGSLAWRIAAGVACAAIVWSVILRGPDIDQAPPSRTALRTYGIAVTALVVAIPVGASIISNVLHKPNAVVVWVVLVVGAHFVPFSRAFDLPVFAWLSASLIVVAAAGAVPALANNSALAAGWTGVAAGFVLLLFAGIGPRLSRGAIQPGSVRNQPAR